MPQKQSVIIDADTANELDDLYAITRLLLAPDIEARGLTSVHFNTANLVTDAYWNTTPTLGINTAQLSQTLNEELLDLLSLTHLPHPLGANRMVGEPWGTFTPSDSSAAQFMIAEAEQLPEGQTLDILSLGAATNVATALMLAPHIVSKIRCFALGIEYDVGRGVWNKNVFNVRADLNAFDYLLDHVGLDLILMPRNILREFVFTREELAAHSSWHVPILQRLDKRWDEAAPGQSQRILWDLALSEVYLTPAWATLKTVKTPPENTERWVSVYTSLDVSAIRQRFFEFLKALSVQS